ncbi:hypothetical protein Vretimale_12435, partial [Volvox reticuliferus]
VVIVSGALFRSSKVSNRGTTRSAGRTPVDGSRVGRTERWSGQKRNHGTEDFHTGAIVEHCNKCGGACDLVWASRTCIIRTPLSSTYPLLHLMEAYILMLKVFVPFSPPTPPPTCLPL